jgi:hypothetical protein
VLKKVFTYSIFSILFSGLLYSQKFHYFSDSLLKLTPGPGGVIHQGIYSYIQSTCGDNVSANVSALLKVDTSGKTIWTAYPTNFIAAGIEPVDVKFNQFILGSDNNLYVWFNNNKLGKLRTTNGSIDWMVPLQPVVGSPAILVDYDAQSVIFANTTLTVSKVRLIRYNKEKGQNLGYVDLQCPGQGVFGIHIATNGNIYLVSRDSCYKYTSFDNPALEWQASIYNAGHRYAKIYAVSQEGNNLLIFGCEDAVFKNGMMSCIDLSNGTLKWFTINGGHFDVLYADHKVKNGFIYTTWEHLYVGSIDEKCLVNKTDINTGARIWELNEAFRTLPMNVSKYEGMMSMDIDANETLYLTGYGVPDDQAAIEWAFMKIRGSDGAVLKRSYIPDSYTSSEWGVGYTARLFNDKLYVTGYTHYIAAGSCLDTATLTPIKTNLYSSTIQYTSSIIGIKNVSGSKKAIFKKIGKSLTVEMVDPFFNKLWERSIGDTLDPYEGIDVIGSDSASVDVPGRKYSRATRSHFYFSPPTSYDYFFIARYDSVGNNPYTYTHVDGNNITNPYQFFQDSIKRTWFCEVVNRSVFGETFPGFSSGIHGGWNLKSYALIRPTTFFPYTKDTLLLFNESTSTGFSCSLEKAWPEYLPVANAHYWYWPSLRIYYFNSAEREGKDTFYVAAKDSSMQDLIFRYQLNDSSITWAKTFDSSIVTLKGYALNGSFYALSTQGNSVFIRKFVSNGVISWTKTIAAPANNIFKLGDFAMSKERQKLTLAGYMVDTLINTMSRLYIVTIDTSGNEISSLLKDGYKAWQNKGVSINIGQDGQTIVSGQISDSVYGYAGFIYEVDSTSLKAVLPIPQAINIISSCSSSIMQVGKLLNPVPPPYDVSIVMDNSVSIPFNSSDSSFSYSIANTGNHTIRITYTYQNSSSVRDSSFTVKATPSAGPAPTQTDALLTAPVTASSYQWYFNNSPMPGSTNQSVTITQSGAYSYTYTIDGCTSPQSPSINAIVTSITDPTNNNAVITIFPNPTSGNITITKLGPSRYGIKLFERSGRLIKELTPLPVASNSTISLQDLMPGTYILQLWNVSKKALIGKQEIILIR